VDGVSVGGNFNRFSSLRVHAPSDDAFDVPGSSNVFTLIRGIDATGNGLISIGGNNNSVSRSVFTGNDDDGVAFFLGSGNSVTTSFVAGTSDKGIIAGASNTLVAGNTVFGNLFGIYLADASTGSRILFNLVFRNGTGIRIDATSSANRVSGNVSLLNTGVDMVDDNANCEANAWTSNLFVTRNQSCIR
jgi:parallel beta-helix repeat protein